MSEPPEDMIRTAVSAALRSPCAKSKRGAVVWRSTLDGLSFLSFGYNAPPPGFACTNTQACRDVCGKICEHAEAAALRKVGMLYPDCELLHVKAIDGKLAPSGPPSCWQCSKAILASKVRGVWLYHASGWRRYTALEFHLATLETCGIEGVQST